MHKTIKVYTIDSFSLSGEAQTGNPAGFVVDLPELEETEMKMIAAAVGFSETAFIVPIHSTEADKGDKSDKTADFKVRFFTPTDEVDLCGHATIGLFSGLYQLGRLSAGNYIQETKAGLLMVKIAADGQVLMEQASPQMGAVYKPSQIAESLGLSPNDIRTDLPCQAVSTGLLDLLIPVKDVETLERIVADDEAIAKISSEFEVVGYHVFALTNETGKNAETIATLRCRNFAPLYGIPEEAATGTSNGALAAYLNVYMPRLGDRFEVTQGVEMQRPSQINAQIDDEGKVWVGGYACHLDHQTVTL